MGICMLFKFCLRLILKGRNIKFSPVANGFVHFVSGATHLQDLLSRANNLQGFLAGAGVGESFARFPGVRQTVYKMSLRGATHLQDFLAGANHSQRVLALGESITRFPDAISRPGADQLQDVLACLEQIIYKVSTRFPGAGQILHQMSWRGQVIYNISWRGANHLQDFLSWGKSSTGFPEVKQILHHISWRSKSFTRCPGVGQIIYHIPGGGKSFARCPGVGKTIYRISWRYFLAGAHQLHMLWRGANHLQDFPAWAIHLHNFVA